MIDSIAVRSFSVDAGVMIKPVENTTNLQRNDCSNSRFMMAGALLAAIIFVLRDQSAVFLLRIWPLLAPIKHEGYQCIGELPCKRRMPLHQPERDSAAERIDYQIDISVGTKLAAFDRAIQYEARDFPSPLGELCKKCGTRVRVYLGLGNQPDECWSRHGFGLEADNGVGHMLKVATDIACIRVTELVSG